MSLRTTLVAAVATGASVVAGAVSLRAQCAAIEVGVTGDDAGFDRIETTSFDGLAAAAVGIPEGCFWHCVVACSVEANNDGALTDGDASVTIRLDGVEYDSGYTREFELERASGDQSDRNQLVVSTAGVIFSIAPGDHTIDCAARKLPGEGNFSVQDSSISIICSPNFIGPGPQPQVD